MHLHVLSWGEVLFWRYHRMETFTKSFLCICAVKIVLISDFSCAYMDLAVDFSPFTVVDYLLVFLWKASLWLWFFRWFLHSISQGLMKKDSRAVVVISTQHCCDSRIITEVPELVSNRPIWRSLAMLLCRQNIPVSASEEDQIFKQLTVFEVLLWVADDHSG